MGSRFVLIAALSVQLAACSWGYGGESDAGTGEVGDDGDVIVESDGGDDPGQPDADLSACETSELSYANFGQGFMESFCLGCHSSALGEAQRAGAPLQVNFDTYELVQGQADRIRFRAAENQDMPPQSGAQPTNEERASISEWINCGLLE